MTVVYVALIAIGVFGLVMTGAFPAQKALANLKALNETQTELIAALERKAEAFKQLADEREKTLALYRKITPGGLLTFP